MRTELIQSKERNYNRYDIYIIILICTLIAGEEYKQYFIAISSLSFFLNIKYSRNAVYFKPIRSIVYFFVFWLSYLFSALIWGDYFLAIIYMLIRFFVYTNLFVLLYHFSVRANKPLTSILLGWTCLFLLTLPIALAEYYWGIHISERDVKDLFSSGEYFSRNYAAVTYYNSNSYATLLAFILPFIATLVYIFRSFFSFLVFFTAYALMIYSGSRGAFLGGAIVTVILLFFLLRDNKKVINLFFTIIILSFLFTAGYYLSDIVFYNLTLRLDRTELVQDDSRELIFRSLITLFTDSYGFGIGAVDFLNLKNVNYTAIKMPHNFMLETLIQYGLVVAVYIFIFIAFLLKKGLSTHDKSISLLLITAILSFIPVSVIDSMYLIKPQVWIYFSSLFIFVSLSQKSCNKVNI